jgi:SPP1 gp7 family putative phage head morphogenesis protein
MASPKRKPLTIVARPTPSIERALLVALAPMVASVRATVASGAIKTPADAKALGVALRRQYPDAKIAALVRAVGVKVERAGSAPWRRVVDAKARADKQRKRKTDAREYDGAKLVDGWTRTATKLITSVRDEVAEGLRVDVVAALESGATPASLAAKWIAQGVPVKWGTLEGRMRVIAQHQVTSLGAEVQRARASAVGVREFVWRSQGDARVRDMHRALDGRRFTYDDPETGEEGLPGQPVNCRCWAESVIPDDLAEALGLGSIFER